MIKNLLRLARITRGGDDTGNIPVQQVEYLGKPADAVIVFPYGVHANVPADVAALLLASLNQPENKFAIPFNTDKRPTLEEGEVAHFHPGTDSFIIFRNNGDLDIESGNGGTGDINIKASKVNITADVNITGDTAFTGAVTANGKDISDTHGHTQGPDSAGDTQAAISGVT